MYSEGEELRSTTVIRDERSADARAIRAVLEAAFPQVVEADLVDRLRATCYTLTKAGRRQLGEETTHWNRIALAIVRALEA